MMRGDIIKGVVLLALLTGCIATLFLPPLRSPRGSGGGGGGGGGPPPELRSTICGLLPQLRTALAAAVGPSQEARVRPLTDGLAICGDLAGGAEPELAYNCAAVNSDAAAAQACLNDAVLHLLEESLPLFSQSLAAAREALARAGGGAQRRAAR